MHLDDDMAYKGSVRQLMESKDVDHLCELVARSNLSFQKPGSNSSFQSDPVSVTILFYLKNPASDELPSCIAVDRRAYTAVN